MMLPHPDELTPTEARAWVVADHRHYLGYTDLATWRREIVDEALIRHFRVTSLEFELPRVPEVGRMYTDTAWHRIAIARRIAYRRPLDAAPTGRAALLYAACKRLGIVPIVFTEWAENASVALQWADHEFDEALRAAPGCDVRQEWTDCPIATARMPWLALYRIAAPPLQPLQAKLAPLARQHQATIASVATEV